MENTDILTNGAGADGKEVSGEDLFRAYQEGKSFDELKEMFSGTVDDGEQESDLSSDEVESLEQDESEDISEAEEAEQEPETSESENVVADAQDGKPFRVFKTQEDFQRVFDRAWGERHAETMRKMTEQESKIEEMTGILSTLLGVPKEKAFQELQSRRWAAEAEKEGYENPDQYAALKRAENQIAEMKQAEQRRQMDERIADIRRQGDALGARVKGFNLDTAMENEMFRQTVFTLQQAGAKDSVEKAFRAVFFDEFMKQSRPAVKAAPRPKEGAMAPKSNADVKPVNVAGLSGREIRDLEKRILNGEKISF